MGTPGFAVGVLNKLVDDGYNIKAVITAADKPAGRGRKILFSDVKKYALEKNIPVLQPEKFKSDKFLSQLKAINADLFIVVAFRMLPKVVWEMPKYGTFNLHASLLPDYRGAAPINHAIINGETKTGVTTFFLNEDIDTGNIIMQTECNITSEDNAGSLHDKLMSIGADLVTKTVDKIESKDFKTKKQDSSSEKLNPAPKLSKEYCKINWNNSAENIINHIRGLSPYPTAWTLISEEKNLTCKIYRAEFITGSHTLNNGTLVTDNKSFAKVAVNSGFIFLHDIHLSGKKRLDIKSLLNGFTFDDNIVLS